LQDSVNCILVMRLVHNRYRQGKWLGHIWPE